MAGDNGAVQAQDVINDVTRREIRELKKQVEDLKKHQWMLMGALGLIVTAASLYAALK